MGMYFVDHHESYMLMFDCTRDTGVGDHRREGITSFVNQHECDYLCTILGLKTLNRRGIDSVGSGDEDGEAN
jgi:hypothetical protein